MNGGLDAYISGGFLLCRQGRRPEGHDPDIVPPILLSGSCHYCPRVPDAWAVEWADYTPEERASEALPFGISSASLREQSVASVREGLPG
jgi:hypothetical protein